MRHRCRSAYPTSLHGFLCGKVPPFSSGSGLNKVKIILSRDDYIVFAKKSARHGRLRECFVTHEDQISRCDNRLGAVPPSNGLGNTRDTRTRAKLLYVDQRYSPETESRAHVPVGALEGAVGARSAFASLLVCGVGCFGRSWLDARPILVDAARLKAKGYPWVGLRSRPLQKVETQPFLWDRASPTPTSPVPRSIRLIGFGTVAGD